MTKGKTATAVTVDELIDLLTMEPGDKTKKRSRLLLDLAAHGRPRSYSQINYWARTNRIPPDFWDAIVKIAAKRKLTWVTRDFLAELGSKWA
jgi:hypothetical protein